MAITPDTKDWTWSVERRCPECGEDASRIRPEQVPDLVRDGARQWVRVLTTSPAVHDRPSSDTWSPLEYACHVRDVFRVFDGRLQSMLEQDNPTFENWDQDDAAVEQPYSEQDPGAVANELQQAAESVAARFAGISPDGWTRSGRRGDGAVFTVTTLARYVLHEVAHHLHDVRFAHPGRGDSVTGSGGGNA